MLGKEIKKYLDENGIKYSFVAEKIEMPMNVFSALLNEKRKLTADEYIEICFVLKVDTNYFAEHYFAEKFSQAM